MKIKINLNVDGKLKKHLNLMATLTGMSIDALCQKYINDGMTAGKKSLEEALYCGAKMDKKNIEVAKNIKMIKEICEGDIPTYEEVQKNDIKYMPIINKEKKSDKNIENA